MIKSIERTQAGMDTLIDSTRDAVISRADAAEERIENAAEAAIRASRVAAERVRVSADSAARGAHKGVEGAAKALDRGYTRAQRDLSRVAARTTDFVSENPGKALLIAAGAGFLIGVLVQRRRRLSA
jgi:ElaB/YqjD/DUF883 family membrane-anchored ribosome-binding protein